MRLQHGKFEFWFDESKISLEDFIENAKHYVHKHLHRIDGPAYIDGYHDYEVWYHDGVLHREDGPAITEKDKPDRYFLFHKEYTFNDWLYASPYFKNDDERIAYKLSL